MKFFLTLTSAILGAALAAPVEEMPKRQISEVTLSFSGAAGAGYSITVPTDGTTVTIDNPLSVSHIYSGCGAQCVVSGAQGSYVLVGCGTGVDIATPQPQVRASCFHN
ncbi:hypothetical protein GJ744_011972 [Endocarpon pusillum]|uniref:SSCRP protein n=1 Tax=Endocarpon pusillum TaxID=364733 RepID=A0A8H7ASR7_9EURO|nr:hypothetical protein GJ744_011972 [Endocarpon pusillum]